MERHHASLQTEELYSQCTEMIKQSILAIQKEISSIKKFLGNHKKEIMKQIRDTVNADDTGILESTKQFYEYVLKELMEIEQAYEKYLLRMQIDLLATTKDRMQPPFYLPLKELRKAYEMFECQDVYKEQQDEISCRCTWENVPKWYLEDTRNILAKPKKKVPTEFDESDLKFKQEIIYLRTKMFSLPKKLSKLKNSNEIIARPNNGNRRASIRLSLRTDEFIEILKEKEFSVFPSVENELSRISSLKFSDGQFTTCDVWLRILDSHQNQFGSNWHLVFRPQVEKLVRDRLIPAIHLNPRATFDFISKIEENGAKVVLTKEDLIPLLDDVTEAVWLNSWKSQFETIDGKRIAATLIQALWRGYRLRKKKRYSELLYIAASLMWFSWITLKKRREMHERYLSKMLTSLQETRELSSKLSKEFNSIIQEPHVVLHLTSIGQPLELRRALDPKMFAILQNMTCLRICFVRNPKSEVIYILPVKPTENLLMMYSDFIESISPDEDTAKRITFIALSQAHTFQNRSLNVSRILHCCEESLHEIRKKIAGKSAYFLPWIVDECDMKLAGNLGVPLLSPDMELQREFLNMSKMSEMIDGLKLLQPPYAKDIKDYDTLCSTLSQLIALHTEVCSWTIKLNFGISRKHNGIFLINHISIPFMPILRREREKHGEKWKEYPSLRAEYLERLNQHLPNVVSSVTRLSVAYNSWKEFYVHVQKFGCLLQAVPVEKNSKTIAVSLFIPGRETGEEPRWMGTADKIRLESMVSTSVYMLPQTSSENVKIEPVVNKFVTAIQKRGYFGYLTVDCYCYPHKYEDKSVVLLLNVFPFYSHLQSYIDWMKFTIAGSYDLQKNQFIADVPTVTDVRRRKSSYLIPQKTPEWNETKERYAIAISQMYHTRFSAYSWAQLKQVFEKCGIVYDSKTKQGSSALLHDSEIRNFGAMVAISPCMTTTSTMVHDCLAKLYEALTVESKRKSETNVAVLADFFAKLSLEYQNMAAEQCV